jgi:hypothetical protein
MFALLFFTLSLNFEVLIDGTELILNVYNFDEVADLRTTLYTGLVNEFESKIKEEETDENPDDEIEYISIANAYAYPGEHYSTNDNTIERIMNPKYL